MDRDELTKELQRQIEEASALAELMSQRGWEIIKNRFQKRISELNVIKGINVKDFGVKEILARQIAIDILEGFWGEIESDALSIESLKKEMENINKESEIFKIHK